MCRKLLFLAVFVLLAQSVFAATYTVTPAMTPEAAYQTIEAALSGDTVIIEPGTYAFRVNLVNDDVIIKGSSQTDRPVFNYTGQAANSFPGSATNWKASYAWIVQADRVTIEDIIIKGARDGESGKGIYVGPDGTVQEPAAAGTMPIDVVIRRVDVSDCDDGIDSAAINLLIEDSNIHGNGIPNVTTGRHNMYIQGGSIIIRNNIFDNALSGQHINLRTKSAVIEGNTFGNMNSFPMTINTPKATMIPGQLNRSDTILRNNIISGRRHTGLALSKFVYMGNANNVSGLTMGLTLENNTFNSVGGTGNILQLARHSGTAGMEVAASGNTYNGLGGLWLRLNAGENKDNPFYTINVQDYSDSSLPGGTTPPPIVTPPPVNGITFNMSWDQADTANLKGWNVWGTTTEGAWGSAQFIPFVEGMTFSYQMDLPQAESYFFKIRPLNILNQEGIGEETVVTPEPVPLPGPTTNFNVIIVP